jgi:hypothetical protein
MSSSECSGECAPGYYCPAGSVSPYQNKCGNSTVYCPPKSFKPTLVLEGFYGTHAEPYEGRMALIDPLNQTLSAQVSFSYIYVFVFFFFFFKFGFV